MSTIKVLLENKFGNLRIPIEVTLAEENRVNFQTVQVPGETIQKTSTMTLESEPQLIAGKLSCTIICCVVEW